MVTMREGGRGGEGGEGRDGRASRGEKRDGPFPPRARAERFPCLRSTYLISRFRPACRPPTADDDASPDVHSTCTVRPPSDADGSRALTMAGAAQERADHPADRFPSAPAAPSLGRRPRVSAAQSDILRRSVRDPSSVAQQGRDAGRRTTRLPSRLPPWLPSPTTSPTRPTMSSAGLAGHPSPVVGRHYRHSSASSFDDAGEPPTRTPSRASGRSVNYSRRLPSACLPGASDAGRLAFSTWTFPTSPGAAPRRPVADVEDAAPPVPAIPATYFRPAPTASRSASSGVQPTHRPSPPTEHLAALQHKQSALLASPSGPTLNSVSLVRILEQLPQSSNLKADLLALLASLDGQFEQRNLECETLDAHAGLGNRPIPVLPFALVPASVNPPSPSIANMPGVCPPARSSSLLPVLTLARRPSHRSGNAVKSPPRRAPKSSAPRAKPCASRPALLHWQSEH